MTNILTAAEAANFLRTTATDAVMLQYLPLVDEYVKNATGHDWTTDSSIHPTAKLAAGIALVYWYDNPIAFGSAPTALSGQLTQLESIALKYRKYEFAGLTGAGGILLAGARLGDQVISLTGTYGVSGSQSASFESTISTEGQIQQTSGSDLSECLFVVVLKHPSDDVSA